MDTINPFDFNDYVLGQEGPLGRQIKDIVFRTNNVIVYLDSNNSIQWFTESCDDFHESLGEIQNKVSDWESKTNKIFNKKDAYDIKMLLAEAYARILNGGNVVAARDILDRVIDRIQKQGREILKQYYAISSLIATILICIIIYYSKYFKVHIEQQFGKEEYKIWMTMLFGGIGAFIFTIIRLKKYNPDIIISKFVHILDGLLRIFYGLIAGLVIAIAIKSNLLLGFLNEIDKNMYVSIFLGVCAGASEVIIPSLIKQMENKVGEE